MLFKKPLLLLLMMLSIAHFAGFLSSSSSTTSTSKIVAFAQAEDGEETTPSFWDDERDEEDDDDDDDDDDDEDPPSNDNPDEIDPYPEIEDDEDSKIWPPPMPEVRHLKQYKVRDVEGVLRLERDDVKRAPRRTHWIRRVVDTWEWPKKEVDVANTKNEEDVGNEERRPYSGDEMTPEEEVAEEAANEENDGRVERGKSKDYTGMDPNRVRLLKKLQSKGLSFMGGENMDIEQLEQLANAMDGINSKNGGDLLNCTCVKTSASMFYGTRVFIFLSIDNNT